MKFLGSLVSVITLLVVVFGAPAYDAAHGNWPGRRMAGSGSFEDFRSGVMAKRLEKRLVAGSALDELIRPRYNEASYLLTGQTNPGVVVGKDNWLFPSDRLGEPGPKKREEFATTVEALGELTRFLEERGCLVVYQLVPRKRTLYPEMLPDGLSDPYVPLFDDVRDAMLAEGLRVPDLRPVLKPEGEPLYFTNDTHWKPEGCRAAATFMADYLRELLPDGEVPGKPMDVVLREYPPEDFIGYQQRLLGFERGSWLFDKFTNQIRQHGAVLEKDREKFCRGSKQPQPIVLLGTSMSRGPYYSASQYVGLLGVQIEDRAAAGYGAGYRFAELMAEILTKRRLLPEVIIWEFPEDFPIREGRYFNEPLLSTIAVLGGAPYRAEPLDAARELQNMTVYSEKDGVLDAECEGPRSQILYTLNEPIAGDSGAVLRLDFNVPKRGKPLGLLHLEWGEVIGEKPIARRSVLIRRSDSTHPIMEPLVLPAGAPINYIRIRPYNSKARIELGNVELWTPRRR